MVATAKRLKGLGAGCLLTMILSGCAGIMDRSAIGPAPDVPATLTPTSESYYDIINLPNPRGPILASVYGFRDQTGQYRQQPDSNFSTAVTQGAASMLVKAMLDSKWFIPLEREGLQNLLTERKIVRATVKQQGGNEKEDVSPLIPSKVLLEGGIIAYEKNVLTGGAGVRYFGIGASDLYRMDQATVSLRAVDTRTGRVLANVFTTKTILSYEVDGNVYKFVKFSRLLEAEIGFTRNEPAQLCVMDAIQAAVVHLIVAGVKNKSWELARAEDVNSPVFQSYMQEQLQQNQPPAAPTPPVVNTPDSTDSTSDVDDL